MNSFKAPGTGTSHFLMITARHCQRVISAAESSTIDSAIFSFTGFH